MAFWRVVPLLLLASVAGATQAQTFPKYTGLVVDAANVLPPAVESDLATKLKTLQRDTKRQLAVVTVPDLGGYDIRDYDYRLGREWGVGLRDVDNGAVLLVAPTERKVSIEVGYGLEPVVTDALSAEIIGREIVPRFKAGDLPGGVVAGADALARQLRASPEEARAQVDTAAREFDRTHRREAQGGGGGGVPMSVVFWGLIFFFVVLPMLRGRRARARGRRYDGGGTLPIVLWSVANEIGRSRGGWGGGGGFSGGGGGSDGSWGGGGFTGGGGGSFGGGGASGSW